jgi:hypothetical protein
MTDPLLRDIEPSHAIELPVLGVAVRFESNRASVIGLVDESLGMWRVVEPAPAGDPLRVRIVVYESSEAAPSPVRYFAPDDARLFAHAADGFGSSDPSRRESVIYTSAAFVNRRDQFRREMLEAMTLALVTAFDRHPVHASAIARDGRAVLLAGASGAGKSTLAHLANAAGFDVLSEDCVWVQQAPSFRLWGWPGHARLIPASGGEKTRVALGNADRASCFCAERAVVCLLGRGASASLARISSCEVRDGLEASLAPGFDRFPARHRDVVARLANGGGWRLTLSDDPKDALSFLEEMSRAD